MASRLANPSNAAPEWQAESLGWRSCGLGKGCPLEGLVRRVASQQEKPDDLELAINNPATSTSSTAYFALALKLCPKSVMNLTHMDRVKKLDFDLKE